MTADFYIRLVLATLIILGFWNAFGKGQILDALGEKMERWPHWLSKPLGICPQCMASVYGTAVWFLTGGDLLWWIPFVLALSGLMVILAKTIL